MIGLRSTMFEARRAGSVWPGVSEANTRNLTLTKKSPEGAAALLF
jgi:hypothetical protein